MNKIWKIIAGIFGFLILFVLSGYLLPKDHIASVERTYSNPPQIVFDTVRNFSKYADWIDGLEKVEVESDTTWTEIYASGDKIRFGIQEEKSPSYMKTKILSEDLPFGGVWEFEINAEGSGSKLKIIETGFVTNPLFRILSKFVFGHTATMQSFLDNLEAKLQASGK